MGLVLNGRAKGESPPLAFLHRINSCAVHSSHIVLLYKLQNIDFEIDISGYGHLELF